MTSLFYAWKRNYESAQLCACRNLKASRARPSIADLTVWLVTIVLQQLANGFEPLYDYDILTWMTYNPRELS